MTLHKSDCVCIIGTGESVKTKKCLIEKLYVEESFDEWVYRVGIYLTDDDQYCVILDYNFESSFVDRLIENGEPMANEGFAIISENEAKILINKFEQLKNIYEENLFLEETTELNEEFDEFNKIMNALIEISPYPVFFESTISKTLGSCVYRMPCITVCNNQSQFDIMNTTLHEIAHAWLHKNRVRNGIKNKDLEFEADFVAAWVLKKLGFSTQRCYFNIWCSSFIHEIELSDIELVECLKEFAGNLAMLIREKMENVSSINNGNYYAPEYIKLGLNSNKKLLDIIMNDISPKIPCYDDEEIE